MSVWKQIVLSLVIVAVAVAAWARFVPGAGDILANWGMDWAVAATGAPDPEAGGRQPGQRQGGGGPISGIVTAEVATATINDNLSAIGTGRANSSVTVNAFDTGRLTEVLVVSGQQVKAGDVLARLDSEGEEIAVDRARIALDDAQARLERVKALRSSNTASAVQVTEAELAVGNARLAVRDAELALDRRSIVSPISGIVGIVPVEIGNQVTQQTAIATIDDRSRIIVDFWVPERYASAITVGMPVTAFPVARPSEVLEGTVSAVDNRLDEASRTLRVQAGIRNDGDTLRAGMSFQTSMKFPGDTYPTVDPLAIQWGTDGAFVWAIVDDRAVRTKVRIIQRNTESVLIDAPVTAGDLVVTEGIHAVREGAEIMVAGKTAAPDVGQTAATPAPGGS